MYNGLDPDLDRHPVDLGPDCLIGFQQATKVTTCKKIVQRKFNIKKILYCMLISLNVLFIATLIVINTSWLLFITKEGFC